MTYLIDLVFTALLYCLFPLLFAAARHSPISKKKYFIICYIVNFVIMIGIVIFAVYAEVTPRGGFPYLLWTIIFTNLGLSILKKHAVLDNLSTPENTSIPRRGSSSPEIIQNEIAAHNPVQETKQENPDVQDIDITLFAKALYKKIVQEIVQEEIDRYDPSVQLQVYEDGPLHTAAEVLASDLSMRHAISQAKSEDGKLSAILKHLPETIRLAIYVMNCSWEEAISDNDRSAFNAIVRRYSIPPGWTIHNMILAGTIPKKEAFDKQMEERHQELIRQAEERAKEQQKELDDLMQKVKEMSEKTKKLSHKSKEEIARETIESIMQNRSKADS